MIQVCSYRSGPAIGLAVALAAPAFLASPAGGAEAGTFFASPAGLGVFEVEVPGASLVQVTPSHLRLKADPRGPAGLERTGIELTWEGARPAAIVPAERATGNLVYWYSGDIGSPEVAVPRFRELRQEGLYEGVSSSTTTRFGVIERRFELASESDLARLRLRYRTWDRAPARIVDGQLVLGQVILRANGIQGSRVRFRDLGEGGLVGLEVDGVLGQEGSAAVTLEVDYSAWLPAAPSPYPTLADHPRLLERLPGAHPGDLLVFRTGVPAGSGPRSAGRTRQAGAAVPGATYQGGDYGCTSIVLQDGDVLDPSSGAFTNVLALIVPEGVTAAMQPGGALLDVTAAYVRIDGTLDGSAAGHAGGPSTAATGNSFVAAAGQAGSGPGAGGGAGAGGFFDLAAGGGGAGYGGSGGSGGLGDDGGTVGTGGGTYGMALPPGIEMGSGGGSGASDDEFASGAGGAGGGGISLRSNYLLLRGQIEANGGSGGAAGAAGGGGGSGGGVLLESSRTTTGTGAINARGGGGSGGNSFGGGGGGGGGGRIKFDGALDPGHTITSVVSAGAGGGSNFGDAGVAGGPGSVDTSATTAPDPSGANVTACAQSVAELTLTKEINPESVLTGGNVVYTLTVENIGLTEATGVTVTDVLHSGLSLVSTSGCSNDPNGVPSCSLGTIGPGSSESFTVTASVDVDPGAGGTTLLTNTAVVSLAETDPIPTDNESSSDLTVLGSTLLTIEKLASPTSVPLGETVEFTITVENQGPQPATGVTVLDNLPAELSLVSTSGCLEDPAGVPTCTLGNLAVDATASYTVLATVDAFPFGVDATITNTATVQFNEFVLDPPAGVASAEVQVGSLVSEIPSATAWSLFALALLLLGTGAVLLRRF